MNLSINFHVAILIEFCQELMSKYYNYTEVTQIIIIFYEKPWNGNWYGNNFRVQNEQKHDIIISENFRAVNLIRNSNVSFFMTYLY